MDQPTAEAAGSIAAEAASLRRRLAEAEATIAELRQRDAHVRMAMEASRVVCYQWDIPRDRVTRLRSTTEPGGFEEAGDFESVVAKVVPEDQAAFRAHVRSALESPEGLYRTEVRYRDRAGATRWVSESGRVVRDARGQPLRIVGVTFDITERKQAEEALRRAEGLLRELLETLPVGVLIAHDPECRRITGNRVGNRLMRIDSEGNISKTPAGGGQVPRYRVFRDGAELPLEDLPLRRVLRGQPVEALDYQLRFDDGGSVDLLVSGTALHDETGAVCGAVATLLDVTAQKRDRVALEEQDRRKNEFLATLAHELRNPLAPIRNAAQILRLQETRAEMKNVHAIIERQMAHMVRLVDDLLDVSRISRGRLELRREHVSLDSIIAQAVEAARPGIDRAGHRLEVTTPDHHVWIVGDAVRLVQALLNLLTNATKYTPPGGRITLHAAADDSQAEIRVGDSGIGMSATQLAHVFDMFWQAREALDQSPEGLGIGLSLARNIVEMHGGRIEARSAGPGRGSEFTLRLPLAG